MKNFLFGVLLLVSCLSYAEGRSLKELLSHDYYLTLRDQTNDYAGSIGYKKGVWDADFGAAYRNINLADVKTEGDVISISYLYETFTLRGKPVYRDYNFPNQYTVKITRQQLENIVAKVDGAREIKMDLRDYTDGFAHGLVITDNLRIRSKPTLSSEGKIIGKLNKFDDVFLVQATEEEEIIDGLEAPWYKIQLDDNTYGWVFGGFVKLYFYEEDIAKIKAAFQKAGSEYYNQELYQDES